MHSKHQNPVASKGELYLNLLGIVGVAMGLWFTYQGVAAASSGRWFSGSGSALASLPFGALFLFYGARFLSQGYKVRRYAAQQLQR